MTIQTAAALTVALVAAGAARAEHVCRYCQRGAFAAAGDDAPPRRYAPPRVVDVLRLRIDVTPDFAAKTVSGETTIVFKPIARPTRVVELDAVDLQIKRVEASRPLTEHHATGEGLKLLFAEPIPVGEEVAVTIVYTAEPQQGLYFRTADLGYPEGEDHIWTQGQTHEAPHWFPCFDYPNERASTEVICRVPAAMTVLSNGRKVSEEVDPVTGLKAVHWRQEKPHVSYLVCLVAGYFHELRGESRGVPLGFYAQPEFAQQAPRAFGDTAAIMAFFEEEIGVPYPWDKYDQVTIRDYSWGGMENTTLTTLTHETLFSESTENIYSSRHLDAHELAHQWFGDYVTCKDWSHLWLNEGFATFYTHLYEEHKLGRDNALYRLYRDAVSAILPKTEEDPRPIVLRGYEEPWEQFDYRAYPKGAWVLHMLRCHLGPEVFREGVRRYLERHALTSVVTDDLRAALEEASGEPLDRFFDQWVYHAGAPRLTVSHDWLPEEKLLKVTVEQEPPIDGALPFFFTTTLRAHVDGRVVDQEIEVDGLEQDFYLALDGAPDVVRFDPEYTLLAEVEHNKSQTMLEQQLKLEGDAIGRVYAVRALGEKRSRAATDALGAALTSDPFFGVRIEASRALGKQHTPAALEALLAGRDQDDARVRLRIVKDLGRFAADEALAALLRVADREPNPAIVGAALDGLAWRSGDEVERRLLRALRSDSFQNQVAIAAIKAIGKRRDANLVDELLAELQQRSSAFPGRRYAEALVALAKAAREQEDHNPTYRWLIERLADPAGSVRRGAIEALGELGDERAAEPLQALVSAPGRTGMTARSAVERLDETSDAAAPGLEAVRRELRQLRRDHDTLRDELERTTAAGADD